MHIAFEGCHRISPANDTVVSVANASTATPTYNVGKCEDDSPSLAMLQSIVGLLALQARQTHKGAQVQEVSSFPNRHGPALFLLGGVDVGYPFVLKEDSDNVVPTCAQFEIDS